MTISPISRSPSAQPVTALQAWVPSLVAISFVIVIFAITFRPEIAGAIKVWNDSTAYNHCYLVLPLVGIMLWARRTTIAALRPSSFSAILLLLPLLSGLWVLAAALDILEAEQLTIIALFEVLILAILGWRTVRALLAPLLFLFFLVPFGAFLVPRLQVVTARIASYGLDLFNIPAYVDGLTIEIPEGTFEIAEACAGLRFLIASVVFGCFFATIIYESAFRRALFIGLSAVVPIIANGMRALGIIVLGHLKGSASAALTDHVLYGWIFFSLVTLILIAIGMSFADHRRSLPREMPILPSLSVRRIGSVTAIGIALTLLGPAYLALAARNSTTMSAATDVLNEPGISGWTSRPDLVADWQPDVTGAQHHALDVFQNESAVTVSQFIGSYSLQARSSALTKTANRVSNDKTWRLVKEGPWRMLVGDTAVTINATEIRLNNAQRRLVWWFYVVDNQVAASAFDAKLLQARAILLRHGSLGAFVALSTQINDTGQPAPETLASFVTVMAPTWSFLIPSPAQKHSMSLKTDLPR